MNVGAIWVGEHIAYTTEMHSHNYYQIAYCKKAGGSFDIDDKHYEAQSGWVYFFQPMQPHAMHTGNNMRLIEIKFFVEDAKLAKCLKNIPCVFLPDDTLNVYHAIRDIAHEGLNQELYCNEATNAALEICLIRMIRQFNEKDSTEHHTFQFPVVHQNNSSSRSTSDVQFIRFSEYIGKHLHEKITLDVLSELLHFNKSYLVEWFKSIIGIPPMKYINFLRVEKAKELLSTTNKSITEIATETGFQSIHYFSRYFKEQAQVTPKYYRHQYIMCSHPIKYN